MILNDKQMKEQLKLNGELKNATEALSKIISEAYRNLSILDNQCTWRNTKISYWNDICLKYDESKLLNAYGDIFFIDDYCDHRYVGRRILWNLELSKEQYEITEEIFLDSDGGYDFTEYYVNVILDKEQESNGTKS